MTYKNNILLFVSFFDLNWSEAEGFSPGTPVFLPLQIRLSRQIWTFEWQTLASG